MLQKMTIRGISVTIIVALCAAFLDGQRSVFAANPENEQEKSVESRLADLETEVARLRAEVKSLLTIVDNQQQQLSRQAKFNQWASEFNERVKADMVHGFGARLQLENIVADLSATQGFTAVLIRWLIGIANGDEQIERRGKEILDRTQDTSRKIDTLINMEKKHAKGDE